MREREYKISGHKAYFQDFDGINEFADYIDTHSNNKDWLKHWEGQHTLSRLTEDEYSRDSARFSSVSGYPEAQDKLKNGVNVREIKRARNASLATSRPKVSRGVYGGVPIVPAYLASCPQNMLTLKPKPERRSLRVFVDCAMPGMVSASEMTKAGEKIVAFLAKLDAVANYDLVAGAVTYDSHDTKNIYGLGVTIKSSGKPFSASRVSFCLTSPAYLRVFEFLWSGRNPNVKYMEGFGRSLNGIKPELYKELMKKHHSDTVVLALEDVVYNGETYINNKFKEAGINV